MSKLIIFDLDGTLYNESNAISEIIDDKIKSYIMKEKKLSEADYNDLEKKIPDLLDAIKKLKINKRHFYNEVYKNIKYEHYFDENKKLRELLISISGKKIICTNSCNYHVMQILSNLKIKDLFDEIYTTEEYENKTEIYNIILKKYKLLAEDVYVVGDNYKVDILPAKRIGFKTIFINENSKIKDIDEAIKIIKNEKEKKYE